uniref:Uncharacterized protein n=1 Tax=Plectus sambesii TaxID=2011161 RepID=A0A914X1F6_9BILA
MNGYNRLERPVENSSDPVVVTLGVAFQQIINLNEREEVLEVNAWLKYSWADFKLKWNPDEYGGVTDLRYPVGSIWKPDVLLYNSVDSAFDSTFPVNMLGYNDGTVTWIPPGIFKVSCKIDITWFPFDEQHCHFKFGSWTFSGFQVDLQPGTFDFSDYMQNGQWALIKTEAKRGEKFYDCCPEPYPDVKFMVHLRRRTLYYAFNLIMPCMLTLLLVLVGFMLSPDSCEKISLQITVVLAICFFLSILSNMTPPSSEAVPLLGVFFSSCMIISTLATGFTVYVQNMHFRNTDTYAMGIWTHIILIDWVPWLLRIKRPGKPINWRTLAKKWSLRKQKNLLIEACNGGPNNGGFRTDFMGCDTMSNLAPMLIRLQLDPLTKDDPALHARLLMLQRIHTELKVMRRRYEKSDDAEHWKHEWKFAAMVIDRSCLYMFVLFIIGAVCLIVLRAPYLNA